MSWAKLDDGFHDNPKILAVGNAGAGLYARALAYCARHLTDGFLADSVGNHLAGPDGDLPERLVDAGLWRRVPGGYQIPDFNKFNPTRAEILQKREQDSARKAKTKAAPLGVPTDSARNPDGIQTASGVASKPPVPSPVREEKTPIPPAPPPGSLSSLSLLSPHVPVETAKVVPITGERGRESRAKGDKGPKPEDRVTTLTALADVLHATAPTRFPKGPVPRDLREDLRRIVAALGAEATHGNFALIAEYIDANWTKGLPLVNWRTIAEAGWLESHLRSAQTWDEAGRPLSANQRKSPDPAPARGTKPRYGYGNPDEERDVDNG